MKQEIAAKEQLYQYLVNELGCNELLAATVAESSTIYWLEKLENDSIYKVVTRSFLWSQPGVPELGLDFWLPLSDSLLAEERKK